MTIIYMTIITDIYILSDRPTTAVAIQYGLTFLTMGCSCQKQLIIFYRRCHLGPI